MTGAALEDKEGAEQNVNAAQLRSLESATGNSYWGCRVNIYPGLPEAQQFPGL